jgi:hypothetical protein
MQVHLFLIIQLVADLFQVQLGQEQVERNLVLLHLRLVFILAAEAALDKMEK